MKQPTKTYAQLAKEFEKLVGELQKKCPHKQWTKWMDYYWAPGHSSGQKTRYCKRCNKSEWRY